MKTLRYIGVAAGVAALLWGTSCVKDTLCNTPHPEHGVIRLSLVGMLDQTAYTASVEGTAVAVEGTEFTHPTLLEPGDHRVTVYTPSEGYVLEGLTARVASVDGSASITRADERVILSMPDYLHTGSQLVTVAADDTTEVEMPLGHRARDLRLELEVTEGRPELIQSVTGTLSGIAGAFDMEAEQTTGEPVATVFAFTREGSKLTADVRLLGTMGGLQTLELYIVFTDGGRTQHTEVNLTEALADFNSDMTTTYRVSGTLETPVGMEEVSTEITGWETVEGGDASAAI